jgi:hypothetical protein
MNTYQSMNAHSLDPASAKSPAFAASPLPILGTLAGATRPTGIALAFAADDAERSGEDRFDLLLVDDQGEVASRLGPFAEEDVVAIWRDLSTRTGLPRMIVREDGALSLVSRQIGRVALGTTRMRRRCGLLGGRRPRFLVRRKTGRLPVRPLIHRGENEIIARS